MTGQQAQSALLCRPDRDRRRGMSGMKTESAQIAVSDEVEDCGLPSAWGRSWPSTDTDRYLRPAGRTPVDEVLRGRDTPPRRRTQSAMTFRAKERLPCCRVPERRVWAAIERQDSVWLVNFASDL